MNRLQNIIVSLLVLLAVNCTVNAQLSVSLVGGVNFASLKFDGPSVPTEGQTGFFAGVLPRIHLGEKWTLGVEAQFSAKGYSIVGDSSATRIEYLDFIPQIEYNLAGGLWIGVGMNFGVKTSTKKRSDVDNSWVKVDNLHFIRDLDAGMKLLGRLYITKKLSASLAINTGIVDIKAFTFTDQNGDPVAGKQLNRNIQLGVGYTFGGID